MSFPKLSSPAILSPMAGVTDVAFRALCKHYGAGLTCTEFVHSLAITHGNAKTKLMLQTDPSEKPVAVQLFGSSVAAVVEAATMVEDRFNIIDVNCGCPAWKVIKTGAGSALLNNPTKIASFINKLVSAVSVPVTLKIRTGIDDKNITAVAVAKAAEDAGAAAIAVHGRTQKQGYRGVADWSIIKQVKESVNIPVIGNGDVTTPEVFKQRMEETGVDAIMIARGAIGNPGIFKQINDYLKKGRYEEDHRLEHFSEFLKLTQQYQLPFPAVRNHAIQFIKGTPGAAKLRHKIVTCSTAEELNTLIDQ